MLPNLHIIANCSDRKLAPVAKLRRLRTVPPRAPEERAKLWWDRLTSRSHHAMPASELYGGGHWSTVRQLPDAAEEAGFVPRLWVISAGYGLLTGDEVINSYSATFSGSHPDSVLLYSKAGAPRENVLQAWWRLLSRFPLPSHRKPRTLAELVRVRRSDYFLLVASPDYLIAIANDLREAIGSHAAPDRFVVISSRSKTPLPHLERNIVTTDARLLCSKDCHSPCPLHLARGPRGSLSAGVALEVLRSSARERFGAKEIRGRLEEAVTKSPVLTTYDRKRASDAEVTNFIRSETRRSPHASCSSLLRKFRDGGRACEQGRFKAFYWQTKGGSR